LVPARKQPGLKAGAFSLTWLVPIAETGINGLYKPGLKAFFPPVVCDQTVSVIPELVLVAMRLSVSSDVKHESVMH
jgi:hypothetical protein